MNNKNKPVLHLTAENLSPEEQFEAMRTSANPVTDLQLGKHTEIEQFKAESTWYLLDNIIMSQSHSSALRYHRDKKKIAQNDDLQPFIFHLSLKGNYIGVSGQHELRSDAGSITVMDLREEIYGQSSDCNLLSVVIPRHLLANADQLHSMSMAENSVKTRILREHMLSLWNALPDIEVAESPVFSQGLVALTNALFSSDGNMPQGNSRALDDSLLVSIKNNIEKNLPSAQLGVDSLCKEFCCSRATLYRLFQPCGGVAHYIKERRLVATFKVLVKHGTANRRIIDVAMQYGFNNQSTFSRMFHQYFGVTPSEVAVLKTTQPLSNNKQSTSRILTAQHIALWLKTL